MTEPERQNWKRIIADIKAAHLAAHGTPLTDYKLGKALRVDKKTAKAIAAGSVEPRHYTGLLILALQSEVGEKIPIKASEPAQ